MQDKLVLLDYDHSVARMAARMLRSERICCKIFPWDTPAETVFAEDPSGLILCAAHDSVFADPEGLLRVSHVPVLALGAAAAFLGTAGDLVESKFKRWVGVKDSSAMKMTNGLGGILDMIDSLLIAPPVLLAFL